MIHNVLRPGSFAQGGICASLPLRCLRAANLETSGNESTSNGKTTTFENFRRNLVGACGLIGTEGENLLFTIEPRNNA